MSTTEAPTGSRHLSFKVPNRLIDQIDHQAQAHGLNRTQYILKAALGELDIDPADQRFETLELRLMRLERQLGITHDQA